MPDCSTAAQPVAAADATPPTVAAPSLTARVPGLISRMYEAMLMDRMVTMDVTSPATWDLLDGYARPSLPFTAHCADGYSFVIVGAQRRSHATRRQLYFHDFMIDSEEMPHGRCSEPQYPVGSINIDRLIASHGGPSAEQIASLRMTGFLRVISQRRPYWATARVTPRGWAEDSPVALARPRASIAPPARYRSIGIRTALRLCERYGAPLYVWQDQLYGVALAPSADCSRVPPWLRQFIEEHAVHIINHLASTVGWDLYDCDLRTWTRVAPRRSPWCDEIEALLESKNSPPDAEMHFLALSRAYRKLVAWREDQATSWPTWVDEDVRMRVWRCQRALLGHRATSTRAIRGKLALIAHLAETAIGNGGWRALIVAGRRLDDAPSTVRAAA